MTDRELDDRLHFPSTEMDHFTWPALLSVHIT